tara:strand:+ start:307 stop:570 length:264 start_codon:yes stop_codon:yes gene_type:complete
MTDEFVMIRYWIRDGEREHFYDVITTKDKTEWTDEKLIQEYIDEDAHIDNEERGTYWVYGMEALVALEHKLPMSRETKELFNSYRIW